jgi:DNA-binding response OmpR family regulator
MQPPATARGAETRRLRILVVEDDPLTAGEIAAILTDAGYDVVGPTGALRSALRLARDEVVDAALVDLQLSGDEPDAGEMVAEALCARGVPFMFVTGSDRMALRPALRPFSLLSKPFSPTTLLRQLRANLPVPPAACCA